MGIRFPPLEAHQIPPRLRAGAAPSPTAHDRRRVGAGAAAGGGADGGARLGAEQTQLQCGGLGVPTFLSEFVEATPEEVADDIERSIELGTSAVAYWQFVSATPSQPAAEANSMQPVTPSGI